MTQRVFRFAPSPNGRLHLGHAYSALLNYDMATASGGRFLLRIEDIDITRCTPEFEQLIYDDLAWLGLSWENPVRRQSEHFDDYQAALDVMIDAGLIYPSFMSRGEVRAMISSHLEAGKSWPHDPDGVPLYPQSERDLDGRTARKRIADGEPYAWRMNIERAQEYVGGNRIGWAETGSGPAGETGKVKTDPAVWGDPIIARKEVPASYHLSVVIDDALQGVTDIVRGVDLFYATSIHRLLQEILGLGVPRYHHHALILDSDNRKLSKSRHDTGISELRRAGMTPADIRKMVGLQTAL